MNDVDINLVWGGKRLMVDLASPIDISLSLKDSRQQKTPSAWYVDGPKFDTVKGEGFIGRVADGGSVNFTDVYFNPHGHGTHTECLGHITPEFNSLDAQIRSCPLPAIMPCQLITIEPSAIDGDMVILPDHLSMGLSLPKAVVIRTLPNSNEKQTQTWDNTNPPYLAPEFTKLLVDQGVEHLLIDLPSVDREIDGGALLSHRMFFGVPSCPRYHATITEFVFVPNNISDGLYALNLQVAPFDLDASPSRPVLFPLK